MRRVLFLVLLGVAAVAFPACDGAGDGDGPGESPDTTSAVDVVGGPDLTTGHDGSGADVGAPDTDGPQVADAAAEDAVVPSNDAVEPDAAPLDAGGPDLLPPLDPQCEGALAPLGHTAGGDETFDRGPYVQSVLGDGAVIVWLDRGAEGEGCVTYRVAGGADEERCGPVGEGEYDAGQFEVSLTELPVGVEVEYRVTSTGGQSEWSTFRTAPPADEPVRLLVFADAHSNAPNLATIGAAALDAGVHAAVGVGDFVSQPTDDQFDSVFQGARDLLRRVPLFPVIGNHESKSPRYFSAIVAPGAAPPPAEPESYYAVRYGSVWMGMLELDDIKMSAILMGADLPETIWLREALGSEEARTARWRLLFIHQPLYAYGWGHCDGYRGEPTLRTALLDMALAGDVEAIFHGHMHGLEYGWDEGVLLYTTGGAGGASDHACEPFGELPEPWFHLYQHHWTQVDAGCDALVVTSFGLDGEELTSVTVPAE